MSTDASHQHKGSPTSAKVEQVPELSKDKLYHLLKSSRRRAVIALLIEHGELSKRDLGELVAAREFGRLPDEIPSEDKQTIKISLHQTHLDALESAGVIRESNGLYYATPMTRRIEGYVDMTLNPDVDV